MFTLKFGVKCYRGIDYTIKCLSKHTHTHIKSVSTILIILCQIAFARIYYFVVDSISVISID